MPSTIKASPNISIVWGSTNAALHSNANFLPRGTLIETLTITPKNGEPVDIEDGEGFAAIQVGCKDGWNAKATAVYDANKVMPNEGDNITVVAPLQNNTAGTTNVNATFWSWGFTRSRKKEAMIELNFTHRPNINT